MTIPTCACPYIQEAMYLWAVQLDDLREVPIEREGVSVVMNEKINELCMPVIKANTLLMNRNIHHPSLQIISQFKIVNSSCAKPFSKLVFLGPYGSMNG